MRKEIKTHKNWHRTQQNEHTPDFSQPVFKFKNNVLILIADQVRSANAIDIVNTVFTLCMDL